MASRERKPYNFHTPQKNRIKLRSKGRDVITGYIHGDEECHHIIHVHKAIEHNLPPRLISHRANGVLLSKKQTHDRLHQEMKNWGDEQWIPYINVMLEHIDDVIHGRISKTLQKVTQPLYDLQSEESIIYEAVGD
jgi:hypothetical protein